MAITGTDYTIDSSLRDNLDSTMKAPAEEFKSAVGASMSNEGFLGFGGNVAEGKVGITPEMVQTVRTAYDTYIQTINDDISKIENPEVNQAFKGSAIEGAFSTLVTSVKTAAQNFTKSLQEAEMAIIEGVSKSYESQDTVSAGDISSDAGILG